MKNAKDKNGKNKSKSALDFLPFIRYNISTGTPASRAVATPVKGGDAMELVYYIIMLYILLEILRTIKK